jgi:hypothetical protein
VWSLRAAANGSRAVVRVHQFVDYPAYQYNHGIDDALLYSVFQLFTLAIL